MNSDDVRAFRTQLKMLQLRLRQELPAAQGLSRTSLQVLGTVRRNPDCSPRDVADELRMTSSNVAAALRELEQAQLVAKLKHPTDTRRTCLSMTNAGSALATKFNNERDTWLGQAIEATLDTSEQALLQAAGKLLQRLAEFKATEKS